MTELPPYMLLAEVIPGLLDGVPECDLPPWIGPCVVFTAAGTGPSGHPRIEYPDRWLACVWVDEQAVWPVSGTPIDGPVYLDLRLPECRDRVERCFAILPQAVQARLMMAACGAFGQYEDECDAEAARQALADPMGGTWTYRMVPPAPMSYGDALAAEMLHVMRQEEAEMERRLMAGSGCPVCGGVGDHAHDIEPDIEPTPEAS